MKPVTCPNHPSPVVYTPVYRGQPCPVCGVLVTLEDRYRQQVKRLPTPKTLTSTRHPCPICGRPTARNRIHCTQSCAGKARKGMTYNTPHIHWRITAKRNAIQQRLDAWQEARRDRA